MTSCQAGLRGPSTRTRRFVHLACLASLLAVLASCRSDVSRDRSPLDPTSLGAQFDRAARAVRAEMGVRLDGLQVRVATLPEIADALYRENVGDAAGSDTDEEAQQLQRSVAEMYAKGLMAKYAVETNSILIRPRAFEEFAELLGIPEVRSEGQVMSVLLHECVHAADEELFHFSSILHGQHTDDAGRAYNAVVEGHAQFVARRLAGELGLSDSFALYTRSLSAARESERASGIERGPNALVATVYEDGERFIAAVYAAGGDEAIRRAFREPPKDLSEISHPGWFLHPDARPTTHFDLEAGLDALMEALAKNDGWKERRAALSEREFAASLTPLAHDEIAPVVAALRGNRQLRAFYKDGQQFGVTLMEFSSAEDALAYLDAFSRMRKQRDETRKEGPNRIEGATYRMLTDPDPKGFIYEHTTYVGDTPVEMFGVCAVNGPVAVWIATMNVEWRDPLILLNKVLARVTPLDGASARGREK